MIEGLNQERAAPTGRVDDFDILQLGLPGFPESDQGFALRLTQSLDIVCLRILEGCPPLTGCLGIMSLSESLLFLTESSAKRLTDDTACNEFRSVANGCS